MLKRTFIAICIVFFAAFLNTHSYSEEQINNKDNIAASVNDTEITRAELQREINRILPLTTYHKKMPENRRNEITQNALENLIMSELKFQKAKQLGIEVKKKDIENELEKIRGRFKSKREFKKTLKDTNTTVDDLKKIIERNLLIKVITEQGENIKVNITEEMIRDYYNKNRKKFIMPEQRRIRHILLKVDPGGGSKVWNSAKNRAEQILELIKDGEDFATLAKEHSDDSSNVNGGELGFIHNGQLISEVNRVAFNLKAGGISDVLSSLYGYHIVKVEEIKEQKQREFDQLNKKMLKKDLERKEKREKKEAWIRGIKKDADITIFLEGITISDK